jgi:hypothetical protein
MYLAYDKLVADWARMQCRLNRTQSTAPEHEMYVSRAPYNPCSVIASLCVAPFLGHRQHSHMWLLIQELLCRTGILLTTQTSLRLLCSVAMVVCAFHDDDYEWQWWARFVSEDGAPRMAVLHMDVLRRLNWSLMPSAGMMDTDEAYDIWVRARCNMLKDVCTI